MLDRLILTAFFLLALVASPVVLVASSTPRDGIPVIVVGAPWGDRLETVISQAGGQILGPESAPFARIATSDTPEFFQRLRDAGAWAVLDGTRLATLCGV